MTTITIPKKLIRNDDLIIMPRRKYEELLRIAGKKERAYTQLDKDLDKAIAEYKVGKFFGPFNTTEEGIKFLKRRKVSKMKR
ncbi:hypothetical protein L6279_03450 [Candidatus Parcubacteria bacterium]|nr:hypothetical protein [Patescibacteria group bacterium]MCG2693136.1 hypothetical protein [Candidatus Parcubacteria bacterium]